MKGSLVVIGRHAGRDIAARIVDGRLEDLAIAPPDGVLAPETVLRGTVGRPVKGLGGAFVDLGRHGTGFLRRTEGLRPGAPVVVQVTGVAEPGKAVPLGTRILIKGALAILTPQAPGINVSRGIRDPDLADRLRAVAAGALAGACEDLGAIIRTAAQDAAPEAVAAEITALRSRAEQLDAAASGPPAVLLPAAAPAELARREWTTPPPDHIADDAGAVADSGLPEMLDDLLSPETRLPGGAAMWIEPTRACVAVDVNTGPDTSPAAALKANIAAIRDLPRQLRLRGLGGQVLIDFAPVPKRDRGTLEQALRAAFRREGGETVVAGWTPLGNYELQRRRDGVALSTALGISP